MHPTYALSEVSPQDSQVAIGRPIARGAVHEQDAAMTAQSVSERGVKIQVAFAWAVLALSSLVATDLLVRMLPAYAPHIPVLVGTSWATFFFALGVFTRSVLDMVRFHLTASYAEQESEHDCRGNSAR